MYSRCMALLTRPERGPNPSGYGGTGLNRHPFQALTPSNAIPAPLWSRMRSCESGHESSIPSTDRRDRQRNVKEEALSQVQC